MYFNRHVKYQLFLSYFNGTWTFSTDFRKKYSNIESHENPFSGRRVVPCGWTDRQTYMKKLIFTFRYFANAPKNDLVHVERGRTEPQHAATHTTRAHSQILLLLLLLLLLLTAIELSLGDRSPHTSTDKTNKNKYEKHFTTHQGVKGSAWTTRVLRTEIKKHIPNDNCLGYVCSAYRPKCKSQFITIHNVRTTTTTIWETSTEKLWNMYFILQLI